MMNLSVQKDRFRHLVSGAILELWKKETGSLASVFIEATVCITSCNSRMTVIQLSDHFPGLIPEPTPSQIVAEKTIQLRNNNSNAGKICHVVGQKRKMNDDDNNYNHRWDINSHIHPATVDKEIGHRGVQSDIIQQHRLQMDSNNNQTFVAKDAGTDGDNGEDTDKEDSCEDSEDEDAEEDHVWLSPPPPPPSLGDPASGMFYRMIPDAGFHPSHARPTKTENKNDKKPGKRVSEDSAIQDMTTSSIVIDDDSAIPAQVSLPAQVRHRSHLNACHRDVDLWLSAPQNYTDQVRDAVRSRLLNERAVGGSTPPDSQSTPKSTLGPFDTLPSWSPIKRENPGVVVATPPLHLTQLSRSLTGAVVSGTRSSLLQQRIAGIGVGLGGSESIASGGVADPDKKEDRFLGQFSGQKIERFDGNSEDKTTSGSEQKTYSCGFCHKTFLFKSKYHEHLPVHTSARPFECHMCTRTYKYKYDLRVHMRTHLGIPTKSTICPFCSEKFATNKLLRSHMKETHREPRQVVNEEHGTTVLESVPSLSPSATSV